MLKFYKKIAEIWGKDATKLFALKCAAAFYPYVLADGYKLNRPLALVLGKELIVDDIVHEISGFGAAKMVPLDLPQKQFGKEMANVEFEVMPILFGNRTDRCKDNLITLSHAMISGEFEEKLFRILPIVIFVDGIPNEFVDLLSGKIFIEGKKKIGKYASNDQTVRELIRTLIKMGPIMKYKLKQSILEESFPFIGMMGKVSVLMLENSQDEDVDGRNLAVKNVEKAVQEMAVQWEIPSDYHPWIELLRKLLFEATDEIYQTVKSDDVSNIPRSISNECLIYDKKYYFISSDFFDTVCKKLSYVTPLEMKRMLHDAGILICEGRQRLYFEVKVPYLKGDKVDASVRRMRLVRSWLDLPGELTWYEKIENSRTERSKQSYRQINIRKRSTEIC